MKKILIGLCFWVGIVTAAEKPAEELKLPEEIVLKSGRTLKNISVVRWEQDRVVLKFTGGADPIPFSIITNVPLATLQTLRDAARTRKNAVDAEVLKMRQAAENEKTQAQIDEAVADVKWEELARKNKVAAGMPARWVLKAWGSPLRTHTAGGIEQWVFENKYVYFKGGRVSSIDLK